MKSQNRRKSKYQLGGYQAAPVQLTPAQLQAQKAEALRQQQINIQRNAATTPTPGARSYSPRLAKYGGMKYGNGGLPAYGAKRKFEVGGSMYGDNTVQSAGQGATGSTSSIVYQENNPELQIQRQKSLDAQTEELQESGEVLEQEVAQSDAQAEVDIQNAGLKSNQNFDAASSGIKSGIELGKQSGVINKKAGSLGVGTAMKAYKAQRAVNLAKKSYEGVTQGVQTAKQMAQGVKSAKLAKESGTLLMYGQKGAETGSSLSAGLGSLAKNPNVLALAANYAGKGIKKLSDDNDATTWTAGEGIGDTLSKAGEYAGYGATLGSIVPGIGNVVGGVVGGIVGTGVGLWQGLTGRNKARKEEAAYEAKKKVKVDKYNTELTQNFGSQMARVNAGKMKQKTYSGYDLGQNVTAKRGGYRNMPQYI